MTTYAHRSGYALHDDKMISSRGIGLFTSLIGTFAVVIAIVFALASQVSPTPTPDASRAHQARSAE